MHGRIVRPQAVSDYPSERAFVAKVQATDNRYTRGAEFEDEGGHQAMTDSIKRGGRGLVVAAALVAAVSLVAAPMAAQAQHHHGGDGIGTGAAVGLGLGAFALGTAVGSAASGYPHGYGYYPAPAYYPPPTPYYRPRSCWDPYYRRYYAC
jgi:hypothetical protein